jgi:hypothetical protein
MTDSARDPNRQDRQPDGVPLVEDRECCDTREHDTEPAETAERNCVLSANMLASCCNEPRFALHARSALHARCALARWEGNTGWPSLAKLTAAAAAIQREVRGWLARCIEGRCAPYKIQLTFILPMAAALRFRPGGT